MEARFEGQVRRFGRALQLDVFERIAYFDKLMCYAASSSVLVATEWSNSSPGEAFGWGNWFCCLQVRLGASTRAVTAE